MPECRECHKTGRLLIGFVCLLCRARWLWGTKHWVRSGAWAQYARPLIVGSEDSFAQIETVQLHSESGLTMVRFTILLGRDKGRQFSMPLHDFCKFWEPCDPPDDPPSVWERLMKDED